VFRPARRPATPEVSIMIMRRTLPLCLLTLILAFAAGCSDDATQPLTTADSGVIRGEIGDSDFEYTLDATGPPGNPIEGPFVLRGSNLHYDDGLGALVVDLTVINHGQYPHHEPVGLTFIELIPSTVTVLNPDNGIHGEGAAIVFQFANDDGMWTPGEASLPRTVQFGVEKGVSIGFVARLDIGAPIDGGTIAGRVWHDVNEDGVMDEGEPGLPGAGIYLRTFSDQEDTTATREVWFAQTDHDGRYAFDRLRAGAYVVSKAPSTVFFRPTTPTEIHVLLTEADGDVADFLDANFGCVPQVVPPPIEVGVHVEIEGKFYEPDVFIAFKIVRVACADDTIPPPEDGARDDDNRACFGGRLRGPVTTIGPDRHSFKLMNTWVISDAADIPFEIQPGMRLDVRVHRPGNVAAWIADSIQKWEGPLEGLRGRVDAVDVDPSGHFRILVLDTWVTVPDITIGGR
jgi:hypothetical protein